MLNKQVVYHKTRLLVLGSPRTLLEITAVQLSQISNFSMKSRHVCYVSIVSFDLE